MTIRELVTTLGFRLNDAPLREYERKVKSAKEKSVGLSNAVGGIGKAVRLIGGAVAAAGITALGKSILDTTGEVEQYRVTLGTMIGDQEKANKIIHDMDYSPVSDFYGTAAAIGGLQGMVTFGMRAEAAADTLTRLGDIAQGNGEAFKSLSLNMGQVFAKGKADATDLKQFVGQGFDVVGEVSKMTGRSRAEIEKAGVSYEQCAQALVHITSAGGKYNGMLAKQSRTLPGLVKQFQSLGAAIRESIGTAVLDKVKDLMQHFLSLGRAMQENIVAVGTKVFDTFLRGIADAVIFFDVLRLRMEDFGGAFTPVKAIMKDVFAFFGSIIRSSLPFLMALAQAVLLAFKPIQAFAAPMLEALKPIFSDVFQFGAEMVGSLLPVIDGLTASFRKAGEFISQVIGKLDSAFGKHKKAVVEFGKVAISVITGIAAAVKTYQIASSISRGISLLTVRLGGLKSGIGGLVGLIKKNPTAAVIAVAVAGLVLILTHLEQIKEAWANLSTLMKVLIGVIGGIVGAIVAVVAAVKTFTAVITIAKAVMLVFNAVCAANPFVLIIMAIIVAVMALIAAIVLIVKNWDKVKAALMKGASAVAGFFGKVGTAIKNAFLAAWSAIKQGAQKTLDGIKSAWSAVAGFFSSLWNGIVAVAGVIWNGIVGVFGAVVGRIQAVWNGITDFFKGLWNKLKETPLEAVQFIKDTFLGLFDGIKKQFFGFIDVIKDGWDKVKSFFSGLWDGTVNFFTGGSDSDEAAPTKVNDLIVTPEGTFSTHPDDTIFAMKNPGALMDRLADFLALSAPQPVFPLADNTASQAVRQSVRNDYSRHSSSQIFSTPINVSVNASGMTAEQARRAVEVGVKGALRDAIAGSRGNIPNPEARRA